MTPTKELPKAREVAKLILISEYPMHKEVERIQSDTLSWAATQIKESYSLEEALLKLSVKYQELQKGK